MGYFIVTYRQPPVAYRAAHSFSSNAIEIIR